MTDRLLFKGTCALAAAFACLLPLGAVAQTSSATAGTPGMAAGISANEPAAPGVPQEGKGAVQSARPQALLAAPESEETPPAGVTSPKENPPAPPKPDYTFTWNISLTSNYVFRGLTQTDGKPAIQGGLDFAHRSGFYLGTWMSNISWYTDQNAGTASAPVALSSPGSVGAPYVPFRSNSANLEWDFYGGYKKTFATDWSFDLGLIEYYYPGVYENMGAYRQPNTTEVYAGLGYKWISLKYLKAISTYAFGVNESKGANYVDLSAAIPIQETGFKILAHVGHQQYPGHANAGYWGASGGDNSYFTYSDYKLGVTLDQWGCTFGAAYTYANTKSAATDNETTVYMNTFGRNIGRGRVAVTITKSF